MAPKKSEKTAKPKEPQVQIEVQKHILVPKHSKLSETAKKELLQKNNIIFENLPRIIISDPGLQGLDVKEGDVVKISRKSPTAGDAFFYRGVKE
ncbi:DNA-directed RNA polymerase subunit RpoH/Rpb5 C-terminal domain-containing protein [Nanoarchaeota archaeon]